jgi:hypothetical protein
MIYLEAGGIDLTREHIDGAREVSAWLPQAWSTRDAPWQ